MSERLEWNVVRDGDSLAMLQSPDGRIFRIQEFGKGEPWGNADDNDALAAQIAFAMLAAAPK